MMDDHRRMAAVLVARMVALAAAAGGLWIAAARPFGDSSRWVALPFMLLAVGTTLWLLRWQRRP
jgi:hypothetical protein